MVNVGTACLQGNKHFSFLYLKLVRVNKIITTKREFLFLCSVCVAVTLLMDGWVCVCVCESGAWVGILQQ